MSACANPVRDLLPSYVAGSLNAGERQTVEAHLAACPACREDLAFWREAGATVVAEDRALPAPPPGVLAGALRQVRRGRPNPLRRAWMLLVAQLPLVRRELWTASALVMAIGWVASIVGGRQAGGMFINALAPLLTAAGVAMIYGPENDPGLELALATPTSPRQVLLARLVLVFSYDLVLGLVATAGLVAIVPPALLGQVVLGWLAPMAFLSALALVLSMVVGTGNAVLAAFMLWLGRGVAANWRQIYLTAPESVPARALQAYAQAWHNPALLFGLAAVCVAVALGLAGRQERIFAAHA